jgi:hypothetical protein
LRSLDAFLSATYQSDLASSASVSIPEGYSVTCFPAVMTRWPAQGPTPEYECRTRGCAGILLVAIGYIWRLAHRKDRCTSIDADKLKVLAYAMVMRVGVASQERMRTERSLMYCEKIIERLREELIEGGLMPEPDVDTHQPSLIDTTAT